MGELSELRRRLARFLKEARERDDLNAITNLRTRIAYIPYLVSDEPEQAESEMTQGIGRWSSEGFQLQHYYAIFAHAEVMLYKGRAWRPGACRFPVVRPEAFVHPSQPDVRVEAKQLRARAALARRVIARAILASDRPSAHSGSAGPLDSEEKAPWAVGQALLVRAGVAARAAHLPQAMGHLVAAEQVCGPRHEPPLAAPAAVE